MITSWLDHLILYFLIESVPCKQFKVYVEFVARANFWMSQQEIKNDWSQETRGWGRKGTRSWSVWGELSVMSFIIFICIVIEHPINWLWEWTLVPVVRSCKFLIWFLLISHLDHSIPMEFSKIASPPVATTISIDYWFSLDLLGWILNSYLSIYLSRLMIPKLNTFDPTIYN